MRACNNFADVRADACADCGPNGIADIVSNAAADAVSNAVPDDTANAVPNTVSNSTADCQPYCRTHHSADARAHTAPVCGRLTRLRLDGRWRVLHRRRQLQVRLQIGLLAELGEPAHVHTRHVRADGGADSGADGGADSGTERAVPRWHVSPQR